MTTSLRTSLRNQMLELSFDATQGCFLGQPAGSESSLTIAPQGLTKPDLMGELGHLLALPVYQLALPFTQEAWRQLEYAHVLPGTTFLRLWKNAPGTTYRDSTAQIPTPASNMGKYSKNPSKK